MASRKALKRTCSGISGRRNRRETIVSIRKTRKEDDFSARRNMAAATKLDLQKKEARSEVMSTLGIRTKTLLNGLQTADYETQVKTIRTFVMLMTSGVPPLFDSSDPQYQVLWETIIAAIPAFLSCAKKGIPSSSTESIGTQIQTDSTFALRFICSMERSESVINMGAIPILAELLKGKNQDLQIHAAWCLGNMAGEDVRFCIEVLKCVFPIHVVTLLKCASPPCIRSLVWLLRSLMDHPVITSATGYLTLPLVTETITTLSALVNDLTGHAVAEKKVVPEMTIAPWRLFEMKTGMPVPNDIAVVRYFAAVDAETIKVADLDVNFSTGQNDTYVCKIIDLEPIESIGGEEEEEEEDDVIMDEKSLTLCDSCWVLVEMSSSSCVPLMLDLNLSSSLVSLLQVFDAPLIISAALRLLESIISNVNPTLSMQLSKEAIALMPRLLFNSSNSVREEACWFMSNIAAESIAHSTLVMQQDTLMIRLVEQLKWANWDIRKEAVWVVSNVIIHIPQESVLLLIEMDVLEAFSYQLDESDPQMSMLIMEALASMLHWSEGTEEGSELIKQSIESSYCQNKLEELCYVENNDVSNMAAGILDTYFCEGIQDSSLPSSIHIDENTQQSGTFEFSSSSSSSTPTVFHFGGPK